MIVSGIILLEGADCCGKSTLAKHICSKFVNSEYVHMGKPNTGQAWQEHRDALLSAVKSMRKNKLVVIDRHFMSEAIYGAHYRKGSEYPFAARHVDRLLYRFGAIRIIGTAPIDYVVQTHKRMCLEREEMYSEGMDGIAKRYQELWLGLGSQGKVEDIKFAQRGYIEQLAISGGVSDKIGWEGYDVTTDGTNLNKYTDYVISRLTDLRKLRATFNEETDNWTGWARKQSVLLVGDKSSNDASHWPFLANSGSSLYLARVLNQLGADESRVCMVNAGGPNAPDLLMRGRIHCGRVIAMGKSAEQALERERVTYDARVRHPQHARRFTANDSSFEAELREAFNGMAGVSKA